MRLNAYTAHAHLTARAHAPTLHIGKHAHTQARSTVRAARAARRPAPYLLAGARAGYWVALALAAACLLA